MRVNVFSRERSYLLPRVALSIFLVLAIIGCSRSNALRASIFVVLPLPSSSVPEATGVLQVAVCRGCHSTPFLERSYRYRSGMTTFRFDLVTPVDICCSPDVAGVAVALGAVFCRVTGGGGGSGRT